MTQLKKMTISVSINAPVESVWTVMLEPESYTQWTQAFFEGSYFQGKWEQGEKMLFLAPNGDGMVAIIETCIPHELISIKHVGVIREGKEDTESDEVQSWAPAYENYRFSENSGTTEIIIEQEVTPEHEEVMKKCWNQALDKVKQLCEQS